MHEYYTSSHSRADVHLYLRFLQNVGIIVLISILDLYPRMREFLSFRVSPKSKFLRGWVGCDAAYVCMYRCMYVCLCAVWADVSRAANRVGSPRLGRAGGLGTGTLN